jgi:hypothetical protein
MSDKIPVCPDCDSAALFPRSGRHTGESGWMCSECDELKEQVAYRDRKGGFGYAKGTSAAKLWEMDPSDT